MSLTHTKFYSRRLFPAFCFLAAFQISAGFLTAANDTKLPTAFNAEKAGKAEGAAVDFTRKALICEWLISQQPDNLEQTYRALLSLYQAAATQRWQTWQAAYFNNSVQLRQAEQESRTLNKEIAELEKILKEAGVPKPELKALKTIDQQTLQKHADEINEHERAAINCERQTMIHLHKADNSDPDYKKYNLAAAETYKALAGQHWEAWRAFYLGKNDISLKAKANIKVLQERLNNYRHQLDQYKNAKRLDPARVAALENIAVNQGILAVKCKQLILHTEGELKKIYFALAENYTEASQLHRKLANAVANIDDRSITNLKIQTSALREAQQSLWEQEKKEIAALKAKPEQSELYKKILETKRECQELRDQVNQMQKTTEPSR